MGAYEFETVASGNTVEDAFDGARSDAQWEHGHGGYTGTIAEKHSFVIVSPVPLSTDEAYELADNLLYADADISDKWGPAGAIPIDTGEWLFFGYASS